MYKGMLLYLCFKYMTSFSIELGTTQVFATGVCNIDLLVLGSANQFGSRIVVA